MIKKIDNIILLGTSHVAIQSAKKIKETIKKYEPKVVAIELDIDRFKSLMSKSNNKNKNKFSFKMIKDFGFSGWLFAIIAGFIQQRIGKSLGIEAGIDMKTAYLKARENKIPVALIDINIRKTLKKLSNIEFPKKIIMFSKLFFRGFDKKIRKQLQFDVKSGVPDSKTISKMIKLIKIELPLLYNILIEDRNKFMVKKLLELKKNTEGNILAVVGAGHLDGMEKIIKKTLNKNKPSNSYNFSFKIKIEDS